MTIRFCSDLHLSHKNIIKFSPAYRPYDSIEEMNAAIIDEWNNTVLPEDTTYILGDISFANRDDAAHQINSLNGKKILIRGNHDHSSSNFDSAFDEIYDYHEFNYNGTLFVLCHYPIYEHKNCRYGSIMVHGHLHGSAKPFGGKIIDVGLDSTGKLLITIDEIIERLKHVPPLGREKK